MKSPDESDEETSSSSNSEFDASMFEDSEMQTENKRESELKNQPYDMALEVSASMDADALQKAQQQHQASSKVGKVVKNEMHDEEFEVSASMDASQLEVQRASQVPSNNSQRSVKQVPQMKKHVEEGSDDESSSSSEEEEEESSAVKIEGAYDPSEYLSLNVGADVQELFQYITRYKPQDPELETVIKPFIPDFIPSVGEMDTFLKVGRPDGKQDDLGLKVLDEPAATQSDATVLELQLRAVSKKQYGDVAVRSIEDAAKNPKEIESWINNISELHRSKPPPQVHYKQNMPDIETLMEVWPDEFEEALSSLELPGPDMELSVEEYARIICTVMDIPIYDNIAESLHVLFTLYQEFKSNQHFMGFGGNGMGSRGDDIEESYEVGGPK
mmetsp:Transcript_12940/g.17031  ORF Transcript_12940/g.17031 Transcript_12940/m.17031 type:complete len:386 (+) Transcript_12940:271-1428(+)